MCEEKMGQHYDRMATSIRETIAEVVPPKQRLKYNGRDVSAETKRLYDLRIRDFASGRKVTKSDRDAWNRTLNKAAKKDYDRWVEKRVQEIEQADEQGNTRAIYAGVRALSGKTKNPPSPQPTKRKNKENECKDSNKGKDKMDMIQTSEELGEL